MAVTVVRIPGVVGATRERGRAARLLVEEALRRAASGDTVEIDVTGLEAMSVSFADELIGKLYAARADGEYQDRGLVVRGAGPEAEETLEAVVSRRRIGALYLDSPNGSPRPVGGSPWFKDTVSATCELGVFAAAELASRLALTPQAANHRLRQLATSGAVIRERIFPDRGGKEFQYRAVTV